MTDLIEVVGLAPILDDHHIAHRHRNFEEVYSELHVASGSEEILGDVESAIRKYFGATWLPDAPTLYDHLILSLRKKDVIATFNGIRCSFKRAIAIR